VENCLGKIEGRMFSMMLLRGGGVGRNAWREGVEVDATVEEEGVGIRKEAMGMGRDTMAERWAVEMRNREESRGSRVIPELAQ